MTWFHEARNLRRFALWNVWCWSANIALIPVWFFGFRDSWDKYGVFYLVEISIIALWLSSLAWWQSCRVEVNQECE